MDLDGLPTRVVSLPVPESRYASLHPVTGGFAWLKEPVIGVLGEGAAVPDAKRPRSALERFDLARRKTTELVSGLDWFVPSGDGEWLVVRDGSELRVVPSQRKADPDGADSVQVDLSRARFMADPVALWQHSFTEVGRFMQHDFWVPDMAGVDWPGVLESYRPVLDRIGTPSEFADLLWEVVGELGTSHAYIRPRATPGGGGKGQVGLLGADLSRGPDGRWQIDRVLPGESSDPRARAPLAAPGVTVQPGDVLVSVDGRPVDPELGPGPLLVGTAGRPVELTVARDGELPRRFAVTPLSSDRRLRYQDWVAGKRQRVRELTGGRAGYLHIPDMMGEGWAHFHRDLRVEMAQEALVVNVRSNRGGHVSELVIEKLARKIIGWDIPRWMTPSTYPRDAPRGPIVALADENAGLGRRHRDRGHPHPGPRPGGGCPHLGRGDRHQRAVRPGGRHRDDGAALRHLAGGLRLGAGEPRRGPRRRGAHLPPGLGRGPGRAVGDRGAAGHGGGGVPAAGRTAGRL